MSSSRGGGGGSSSTNSSKRRQQQQQQQQQQKEVVDNNINTNTKNPVVASLSKRSPHPYSSISLSPSRSYVVTACKDALQLVQVGGGSGTSGAGLVTLKTIACSHHFAQTAAVHAAAPTSTSSGRNNVSTLTGASGLFGLGPRGPIQGGGGGGAPTTTTSPGGMNVYNVITDVAWSPPQQQQQQQQQQHEEDSGMSGGFTSEAAAATTTATATATRSLLAGPDGSLIAAAGSNGVIVVWTADALMESAGFATTASTAGTTGAARSNVANNKAAATGTGSSSSSSRAHHLAAAPEAVLSQHVRAVNRLAWHPTRHGLLLSASQDSTVRLWERRKVDQSASVDSNEAQLQQQKQQEQHHHQQQQRFHPLSLFSAFHGNSTAERAGSTGTVSGGVGGGIKKASYSWHCRSIYEPKSEAVRDIQWSPFHEDVFAIATAGGSLVVYNMRVRVRALVKIAAHSGDATTLSWHPSPRMGFVIATGGATDRCVKVWNLESYIDLRSSSFNKSESDGGGNGGGNGGGGNNNNNNSNLTINANTLTSRTDSVNTEGTSETDRSTHSLGAGNVLTIRSGSSLGLSSRHHSKPKSMMHVLSISSSVMRVRWRPPAWETFPGKDEDRHESMLAVATASIKGGASAGGSGRCELWSFHRPFMPLSVVEGHKEGAVTDFEWLETPTAADQDRSTVSKSIQGGDNDIINNSDSPMKLGSTDSKGWAGRGGGKSSSDALAVRSGARLQKSSNSESEYGLVPAERGDQETVDYKQVGIWQHVLSVGRDGRCLIQSFARGDRPILRVAPSCFAITNLSPFQHGFGSLQVFSVCQQVPGLKQDFLLTGLRKDGATASASGVFRELPSDADVQDYSNTWVAGNRLPLNSPTISFNIVDQGNLDADNKPLLQEGERQQVIPVAPEVVHLSRFADQYKLYPGRSTTRAQLCFYNGDVAESLQREGLAHMWRMVGFMLEKAGMDTLPAIDSEPRNVMHFLILQTIENLLQELADEGDVQTCVALCEVLQVVASNETTRIPGLDINLTREWYLSYIDLLRDMCLFSEAALLIRSCKDPFLSALNQKGTTISESCPHCGKAIHAEHRDISGSNARRACKSCRRRVAMCFICHEPVTGMYVWCPGCGHGGHLEHALSWFGGLSGSPVREVCPTGCGHRCNLLQTLTAFPRTESLLNLDRADLASDF